MTRDNHSHQFLSLALQYIDLELLMSSYKILRNNPRNESNNLYSLKHIQIAELSILGLRLLELFFQLIVIENDKHRNDRRNF